MVRASVPACQTGKVNLSHHEIIFHIDIIKNILYNNDEGLREFLRGMIMNEMKIRYSRDSIKFLSKLDKKSVNRIRTAIEGLTQSPPVGDIKPMQGFSDGRKRLRVGSWRIIFKQVSELYVEIIFVIDIGNRGDIYK